MKLAVLIFGATCALLAPSTRGQSLPLDIQPMDPLSAYPDVHPSNAADITGPRALLPLYISPEHYTLFLRPILDPETGWAQFSAPGTVTIRLRAHNATDRIILHRGRTLQIHEAAVVRTSTSQQVAIVTQSYDDGEQQQTFALASALTPGDQYELFINFTSRVAQDSNSGLYLARYKNDQGEEKRAATTQFQRNGAREAFPCFDEPNFKAVFSTSLARTADYNSLSNSPQTGTTADPNHPGWFIDSYNQTVTMSSYLIAMIVSEFTCTAADPEIFPGRPVRACGPSHLIARGGGVMSANASAHILQMLETNFKYPYEQYKMDSAAIPDDYFGPGAMENWGLNTYKESLLMYYPGETLESSRRSSISVLTHELAHQWFGDLVTCRTWQGIWLNEGFATYVAAYFEEVTPEFDSRRELLWDVQTALNFDVGVDISIDGSTASTITYSKGGSVLRMLEGFMTRPLLLEALQEYLRIHAYQPVVQDDLFTVLTKYAVAGGRIPAQLTMKEVMDTWTKQPGYPLLRVFILSGSNNRVAVSQERFLSRNDASKVLDPTDLWEVPIYISSPLTSTTPNLDRTPDLWLSQTTALATVELDTNSWSLFNADALGYYRVIYDDQLFSNILTQLADDPEVTSGLARAQLIDDYFKFNNLGHVSLDKPLSLTKYLLKETDHIVWTTLFNNLRDAFTRLGSRPEFRNYWLPRLETLLDAIGIESKGDRGSSVIFRARVLDWAKSLVSPVFATRASLLVELWKLSPASPVTLDYRSSIYCGAVADLQQSQFDFFLEQYNSPEDNNVSAAERSRFLSALSCPQSPAIIQRALEAALNETLVRREDVPKLLQGLAGNLNAGPALLTFLQERFQDLVDHLGGSSFITNVVTTLSASYNTEAQKTALVTFIEEHRGEISNAQNLINQVTSTVNSNIQWMTSVGEQMLSWFSQN